MSYKLIQVLSDSNNMKFGFHRSQFITQRYEFYSLQTHLFAGAPISSHITGIGWCEFEHAAKILLIGISTALFHDYFIGKVTHMLKNQETAHQYYVFICSLMNP